MSSEQAGRMRAVFENALAPYKFRTPARALLRATPEYREALRLGVARKWLDEEGDSLSQLLAEAAKVRLADLEPPDAFA